MHYNPHSIAITKGSIQAAGDRGDDAVVLIESCPKRWKKTAAMMGLTSSSSSRGSRSGSVGVGVDDDEEEEKLLPVLNDSSQQTSSSSSSSSDTDALLQCKRFLLYNEMVAAAEMARDYRYPLLLGDQRIEDTSKRLKESFVESLKDLVTLRWTKLASEIKASYVEAVYVGSGRKDYLGAGDFFNAKLLMYIPVSLVRYPLALVIKAPKFGLGIIAVLVLLSMMDAEVPSSFSALGIDLQMSPMTEAVTSMVTSFLILVSEIALLGTIPSTLLLLSS